MLGELRVFGIHLQLDAGGHVGEAFQQPLDIGIGALKFLDEALEAQTPGDLREIRCELAAALGQMPQLAIVIFQKARIHQSVPSLGAAPSIDAWPVSMSISVLIRRCSGMGCAHKSPSISKPTALRFI